MKSPHTTAARKRHPSICTSTIASAVMVLSQVSSFGPSALATTFNTATGTVQTAPILSDGTGLIMDGGGLLLLNSGNTYTGTTAINDGSVSITAATALGTDPSTITIDGPSFQTTRGGGAGNLTVGGGITIDRNFAIRGLGSTIDTGAITSVGNNTFTGSIATGTGLATRILSTAGTATIAGPLTIANAQALQLSGNGNWLISGATTATSGQILKNGAGFAELTGINLHSGGTRVDAGFLRVGKAAAVGTGTTAIVIQGGTFEIRSDDTVPDAWNGTKNVSVIGNGTLIFDRAVGGTAFNETIELGTLTQSVSSTLTVNGRNGYGASFTGYNGGGAINNTISNNLNGVLAFATGSGASFWNQTDATARTLAISGSGDTLVNGAILASGGAHILTKSGTGTLTLLSTGTGSNRTGATNINGGTLAIDSFRALNSAATGSGSRINIGTGATAGALNIIGTGAPADYTTAKTINLAGTTGGATLNANQTSANPVEISSLTATALGSKTLTLGGSNASDNRISGVIANGGTAATTTLVKVGTGTWVLSGNNTYSGSTTIGGGTLKLSATAAASDIVKSAATNTVIINVDAATQTAGGTLQFTGVGLATTETLGALTPTAGMGTVRLTSGGAAANLVFTSLGAVGRGSGVNFDTTGAGGGAVTITGLATTTASSLPGNGHFYINGADFARSNGGVLVTPVYGTDAGFVNAVAGASSLTVGSHNLITGNITAQTQINVTSLKMSTHTLTLAGNLTVNTGGAAIDGGILVSGGNTAAIAATGTFGVSTGGGGTLVVRVNGANDALTLSAPMLASLTGGFTKNGAGTLVLAGNNLQTGATTINEGTVQLSGAGTLSGSSATTDLAVRQGAILDLNGVSSGTSIRSLNGAGTITNGASAVNVTLTVGNNNGTGIFSGVITSGTGGGVMNVVKNGTGAQTWSGLNTYAGSTRIDSTGTVSVSNLANGGVASSIGASGTAASNLVFSGASATGASGGISYTGTVTASTDRLFTLAGNAVDSGGRILADGVNNASLIFSNTGAMAITGTVAQTLTLGGASTGDNRMNVQLADGAGAATLSIRKEDAGRWILGNAANSYTGTTLIANGELEAGPGGAGLGSGGLILGAGASGGAIFQSSGNFTRTVGTGAGTVSWGATDGAAGFAASSAKFNVNLGPATWGTGGFVQTNAALLLNSDTALAEVDYQSGINLNGGVRTIQVNDNLSTGSDFATISGVISGAGGLIKTGSGLLNLGPLGTNTYTGNTEVRQGAINVTSLGQSAGGGASSVGAWGGGAVQLGFNATPGILDYVGAGETSSRLIQATGSSGQTTVIRANGTGPLILSNVLNNAVATGTLGRQIVLGGENIGPNEITSILSDNGGPLGVVKSDGGVWVMSQQHTYSGATTINNSGTLGIGASSLGTAGVAVVSGPLGTGILNLGNASLVAVGGDRSILNPVRSSGTAAGFTGINSLSLNGTVTAVANTVFNNFLPSGKTLTINGTLTNDTAARTVTIGGTGDTVLNGLITQAGTANLTIVVNPGATGSLRIGGTAGLNTYGGSTTLTSGTLILDKVGAIGTGGLLNITGPVVLQATSDPKGVIGTPALLGANATVTVNGSSSVSLLGGLTNSGVNRTLTSDLPAGKSFTLGGNINLSNNNTARTLIITGTGQTVISGAIHNGGNGAGSLRKVGAGDLVFTGSGSTYTGTTGVLTGRLILAGGGNERLPVGTTLALGTGASSGILQLGNAAGPTSQTIRSVVLVGTGTGNAVVGGNAQPSALAFNNAGPYTVPIAIGLPTGTGFDNSLKLVKTGTGELTINLTNAYTGGTEIGSPNGIDGGILKVEGSVGTLGGGTSSPLRVYGGVARLTNDQVLGNLTLGGGGPGSTAQVIVESSLSLNGNITFDATNNPNPATIGGFGVLKLNESADTTITVGSSSAGSGSLAPDLTISAGLSAAGPTNIRKAGPGTLRILPNGATDFANTLFIDAGTVILDGPEVPSTLASNVNITVGTGTKLNLGASSGEKTFFQAMTIRNNSTLVFNLGAPSPDPINDPDGGNHDSLDVTFLTLGTGTSGATGASGLKLDINALTGFATGTGASVNRNRYRLLLEGGGPGGGIDLTTTNPFTLGNKPGGFTYTIGAAEVGFGSGVFELFIQVTDLVGAFFWKGGIDSNWNTQSGANSNWVTAQSVGAVIAGAPGLLNDVIFSADSPANQTNTTVDLNSGVKSLTIDTAMATTIKGVSNTILSIANGLTVNPSAGSLTLGSNVAGQGLFIAVGSSQSWTNNGTGPLTVLNQIFSYATTGVQTLTFAGTSLSPTVINGNIINGGLGGAIAVSKTSDSTLTLGNPNNSYTGGTKIAKGILEFASGALSNTGAVEFTGSAALRWLAGNTSDISDRLKINDGFTGTVDTNGNNVTFANPLQVGVPTTGALTKAGLGTLTLAGIGATPGYSGGTNIAGGTLAFTSGALGTGGNIAFTGTSVLRWSSGNGDDISARLRIETGFIGTLDTNGNDVTFAAAPQSGSPTTGVLTKAGAGTLSFMATGTAAGYTGGTNIDAGTLEFSTGTLPAAGNIAFTNNATLKWSAGNTEDVSSRVKIGGGLTGSIDTNGNNVTFASPLNSGGPSTTGGLRKTGDGELNLAVNNTFYSGATTVDQGTLAVSGSISGSASVNVSAGATFRLAGSGDRVADAAPIAMGAGAAVAPATLAMNDADETAGVFTLAGAAVIDFGSFDSGAQLKFAASSGATWTGTLSIWNWTGDAGTGGGADQLFFGTNASGLNASQLSRIQMFDDAGLTSLGPVVLTPVGELVPVPEPASAVSLLVGTALLLGLRRRRR